MKHITMSNNNTNNSHPMQPSQTKRSLAGIVTKLVGDGATYGFINDEIFFQQDKISGGGTAAVGDQVYAECEYSANLPIKWNATSVKILNKAMPHQINNLMQAPIQQNQQPFNITNNNSNNNNDNQSPAITYQQHRQQRQMQQQNPEPLPHQHQQQLQQMQLQHQHLHQQQNLPSGPNTMIGHQNTVGRLLPDPSGNKASPMADFNYMASDANSGRLLPSQTHNQDGPNMANMPPMGPPNFAFNNHLGGPQFMQPGNQGQFIQPPSGFLGGPQQGPPPPHLLANQPPPLLATNSGNNNNNNNNNNSGPQNYQQQRQNKTSGGGRGDGGGRFGDSNNKPNENRQSGNRNNNNNNNSMNKNQQNRHDNNNKLNDRPKSGDRAGSLTRHQPSGVSNKSKNDTISRDTRKRGDSSARSSSYQGHNVAQEKGPKSNVSRRLYDVQNIPKCTIGVNLNPQNIKLRCPSSMHVPSDLKEVIINRHYRFDLKNIPKPVNIVVENTNTNSKSSNELSDTLSGSNTNPTQSNESEQELITTNSVIIETKPHQSEDPTPPTSKTDLRLNHKYGVKVMLLSLPEMETIYKHVFGPELDSLGSESGAKIINSNLDNMIQILCNKGSNNGYSLVGGKFDPSLDGFVEGVSNEFERGKKQPDLIATCRRLVLDQYNLDLSSCKSWTWLATFIYNNRSDYFSQKASIEYSYIYIPQLWTMKSDDFDKIILQNKEIIEHRPVFEKEVEKGANHDDQSNVDDAIASQGEQTTDDDRKMDINVETPIDEPDQPREEEVVVKESSEVENEPVTDMLPEDENKTELQMKVESEDLKSSTESKNLNDMKVTDLKFELDRLVIKYKSGAKKSELIDLLREYQASTTTQANKEQESQEVTSEDVRSVSVIVAGVHASTTTTTATTTTTTSDVAASPTTADGTMATDEDPEKVPQPSSNQVSSGAQPDPVLQVGEESQLSEGEVAASANASDSDPEPDSGSGALGKRKFPHADSSKGAEDVTNNNINSKKARLESPVKSSHPQKVELVKEPFIVKPRDSEQQISLVSLHEAHQPARYDQFELSMATNILKESLILHFSEYVLTTLVEDHKQRKKESSSHGDRTATHQTSQQNNNDNNRHTPASSGASNSSQETTSDSNNNAQGLAKSSSEILFKNPSSSSTDSIIANSIQSTETSLPPGALAIAKQEYPVPRYINLAFSYFDANQMGYLQVEDLSKLFNNTRLTISKRALISILNSDLNDRVQYQFLPDLSPKLGPTYVYEFPQQFNQLPGSSITTSSDDRGLSTVHDNKTTLEDQVSTAGSLSKLSGTMIEFRGQTYDVEKLIHQVREAEALRVSLVDRFNYAIENSDKQAEEIHVLEVSRKSLANAIKSQNDEICELKRERDAIKKRVSLTT